MAPISWCPAGGQITAQLTSPHTSRRAASSHIRKQDGSDIAPRASSPQLCDHVTMRCAEMREFALYPSYLSIISGTGFYRVKYAHSRYFVVSIIMNEKYLDAGLDWAELGLVFG